MPSRPCLTTRTLLGVLVALNVVLMSCDRLAGDPPGSPVAGEIKTSAQESTLEPGEIRQRVIWMSREEIRRLPMEGTAWQRLLGQANEPPGIPNIADQSQMNNVYVLAKALVYVRTGEEHYRDEVVWNCMAAIDTELGGRTLALGRELAAYVISADLVGLDEEDDVEFRAWLRRTLTEELQGRTLQSTHEERPNNWGTMCGASRAAVAVYLGDTVELERTAQVFKGWLGDRSSYTGFVFGEPSWQDDPAAPVGINRKDTVRGNFSIGGVIPDDMRRGCPFTVPPCPTWYPWEALQGAVLQAEILHRQGYDTWKWSDQALFRAVQFLFDMTVTYPEDSWWADGDDEWVPWLVNHAYGSLFPTAERARPGKNMGWTNWTHASRD